MEIRRATSSDLDAILSFDRYADVHSERKSAIEKWIEDGACYVALAGVAMAGYAALEYSFYGNGFLAMLYVSEAHRRQGIGAALIGYIESTCITPKLFTSTNRSNEPMQRLLAKLGYETSGIIENLDDGDPELVYVKRVAR